MKTDASAFQKLDTGGIVQGQYAEDGVIWN
jgi:hypothetical protein